jgi:hypothetical protein
VLVYIRNAGNISSSPCHLRLVVYTYDSEFGTFRTYTTAYYTVPAIPAGGLYTQWTYSSPSIYFPHFLFDWTIDALNDVAERNEYNNEYTIFNP